MKQHFTFQESTEDLVDDSWISKENSKWYIQVHWDHSSSYLIWEDTFDTDGCYVHHYTETSLKAAMERCHAAAHSSKQLLVE